MADDDEIVKYVIRQSKSQAGNGISLADVVGDVGEGIDLEYCSFFIDSDDFDCTLWNNCMCHQPCSTKEDCKTDSYCTYCTGNVDLSVGSTICVSPPPN